jgi:hypothetical protein
MGNDFVGLADYAGHFEELGEAQAFGHGGASFARRDMVQNLNKALATNGSVGADGSVLIPQSLETTLQVLSFKQDALKLWQRVAKKPAFNVVEQFDYLEEYGSDELGFIEEGGLPPEDDSKYGQDFGKVKFMGTTRSVTHPMTLVNTIAGVQPIIDREDRNGTMQLLRTLETALFFGDDRVNPQSVKGIFQQIEEKAPKNIIDLRGKAISDVVLEDLDNAASERYGKIDVMYMENRQKTNLSLSLFGNKKIDLPTSVNRTNLGMVVNQYQGNNGNFDLESHQFVRRGGPAPSTAPTKAPATPASVTATPRDVVGETSILTAGSYVYTITAVGAGGESLGVTSTAAVVADTGDCVDVVFPNVVGAVFYKIYRGDAGKTPLYLTKVARTGTANVTYTDLGKWLPGTSMSFALQMDPDEGMAWKQLAPLMKLPLAQIDTKMRWAILLYGVLQVYQPLKNFVLINVGDSGITHEIDLPRPRN